VSIIDWGRVVLPLPRTSRVPSATPSVSASSPQVPARPAQSQRRSRDSLERPNLWGRQLLDLCISTSMRIANGRVLGDEQGQVTFVNQSGDTLPPPPLHSRRTSQPTDTHVRLSHSTIAHRPPCFSTRCRRLHSTAAAPLSPPPTPTSASPTPQPTALHVSQHAAAVSTTQPPHLPARHRHPHPPPSLHSPPPSVLYHPPPVPPGRGRP